MGLKIPKYCDKIVEWIRADSWSPFEGENVAFHITMSYICQPRFRRYYCPMGTLRAAVDSTPHSLDDFDDTLGTIPESITDDVIEQFANWWDSLTEEQAYYAAKAIWQIQ